MTSVKPKVLPILEIIQKGTEFLLKAKITNAKLEIEWFLCDMLNCNRIDLYVRFDEPLFPSNIEQLRQFLKRRKNREPFQYILEKAPFYSRDFVVSPAVLIPRPETELLIDILKNKTGIRSCFEVGTGSGCIAITALLESEICECTAIDNSPAALHIAEQNSKKFNSNNINFMVLDFLKEIPQGKFDVILSNPPYIMKDEMKNLEPELSFEPESALTDYNDGLSFYRRFAETAKQLLNKEGIMLIEIGDSTNLFEIEKIFSSKNFSILVHKDLKQIPRVIEVSTC